MTTSNRNNTVAEQLTIRVSFNQISPEPDEIVKPPLDKRKITLTALLVVGGLYLSVDRLLPPARLQITAQTEPQSAAGITPQTAFQQPQIELKPAIMTPTITPIITEVKPVKMQLQRSKVSFSRMQLSSGVIKREPVDDLGEVIKTQANLSRRLYFFTEFNAIDGASIYHRWKYNGESVAELNLPVRQGRWRTYSSKNISSANTGRWSVEVLDEQHQLLQSYAFVVNTQL
ncbi:MAG: hypothetical protein ACI9FJ_001424 [Alteromonadaceae bacterium]|jgi:hypothetical protein